MHSRILSFVGAVVLFFMAGISSADSLIWSADGDEQSLAADAAALFTISAGQADVTSDFTRLQYYNDSNCSGGLIIDIQVNGNYTFISPTALLKVNAGSIWRLNQDDNTRGIKAIPQTNAGPVFTRTPCFAVTCSSFSASCVYTGGPEAVSLTS